jgi:hypothetical protein
MGEVGRRRYRGYMAGQSHGALVTRWNASVEPSLSPKREARNTVEQQRTPISQG